MSEAEQLLDSYSRTQVRLAEVMQSGGNAMGLAAQLQALRFQLLARLNNAPRVAAGHFKRGADTGQWFEVKRDFVSLPDVVVLYHADGWSHVSTGAHQ